MNPEFPVYIVSKGRWDTRLTSRELERIKVPYRIVVEPQEADKYKAVIDPAKVLVLPFGNLGIGSTPARNWIWEHAISTGAKRHWIIDDNIENFHRMNRNMKPRVTSGTIFRIAEDFVCRYENVPLAGFNYYSLCKSTDAVPPFVLNTRVYSCLLIDNALQMRWEMKYNEDVDLSLRVLKAGYCTIQFNAFLAGKVTTLKMRGGNTDTIYVNGTLEKAEAIVERHPDVAKVVWRYGRWHHHVDYRPFKNNKLILRKDVTRKVGTNEYGMKLVGISREEHLLERKVA